MANLKDRLMGKTAHLAEKVAQNPGKSIADQAPVTMPGQLGAFRLEAKKYTEKIAELDTLLTQTRDSKGTFELRLHEIYRVPGRRRKLTDAEYSELKENLRNHPLAHAVTVRIRAEGLAPRYELISGYNRDAIYGELGRQTIRAEIVDCDEGQAELSSLFANLFQSNLSDFETYIGFQKIMLQEPELTPEDVAERVGKSRSYGLRIMSFQDLPEAALTLLAESPHALGGAAAQDLATVAKKGRANQVVNAIAKVISGEIKQGDAKKYASTDMQATKVATSHVHKKTINVGKATYCNIHRSSKVVRFEFKSDEEAAEMCKAFEELLKNRSESLKKNGTVQNGQP